MHSDCCIKRDPFDLMMEVYQRHLKPSGTQVFKLGRTPDEHKSSKKQ